MNLLEAREQRNVIIQKRFKKYLKPVLSLKANIVGIDKNKPYMKSILFYFETEIEKTFQKQILYKEQLRSIDGNTVLFVIDEDEKTIKSKTEQLESSKIGRLIDIDVYVSSTSIKRTSPRTCLICDDIAFSCIRSKRHSIEEVQNKTEQIVKEFYTYKLIEFTNDAILKEVELHPKFGLVTKESSGCHKDMNYNTFVISKNALHNGIKQYIEAGFDQQLCPNKLIEIGKQMEQHMFIKTNHVNTHKGLIFLLGFILPIYAHQLYYDTNVRIEQQIKKLAKDVLKDYYNTIDKTNCSNGEQIYKKTKIKGIRGEVENGLKVVYDCPKHNSLYDTLLYFMSTIDDTTIIHKTSLDTLKTVQKETKKLLDNGGYSINTSKYIELSNKYLKQNISPGGSADLLVIKILIDSIYQAFKK